MVWGRRGKQGCGQQVTAPLGCEQLQVFRQSFIWVHCVYGQLHDMHHKEQIQITLKLVGNERVSLQVQSQACHPSFPRGPPCDINNPTTCGRHVRISNADLSVPGS